MSPPGKELSLKALAPGAPSRRSPSPQASPQAPQLEAQAPRGAPRRGGRFVLPSVGRHVRSRGLGQQVGLRGGLTC